MLHMAHKTFYTIIREYLKKKNQTDDTEEDSKGKIYLYVAQYRMQYQNK